MTDLLCLRSLWETLISAASTFGLFVATTWGIPVLVEGQPGFYSQILFHTMYAVAMPMVSLSFSLWNGSVVWMVKRRLGKEENSPRYDSGSIAIITRCPMYIRIPREVRHDVHSSIYAPIDESERFKDLCPLEFRPRQAPPSGVTTATDGVAGRSRTINAAEDFTEWLCLPLPNSFFLNSEDIRRAMAQRLAILSMSLVPTYEELSIIRSRNTFQTVVTTLQACGYMLSVLQRIVQGLGISPIEAIITFLCIIVILHLLIEPHACGSYQRPFILHLNVLQARDFCAASTNLMAPPTRNDLQVSRQENFDDDFQVGTQENVVAALLLLLWSLISAPAIYYFYHYLHTHFICALSAFLFSLSQTLLAIFLILVAFFKFKATKVALLLQGSGFLYASSIILAVVSTAVDWKEFHNRVPHNWFAWILPHASS